jgi:prophage regulatory protein
MPNIQDFQPAKPQANALTSYRSAPDAPRLNPYKDRLLRLPDVLFLTGLGKSSIYACIKEGTFPGAVNLTDRAVAWRESEVNAWISTRTAAAVQPGSEETPATKPPAVAATTPCRPRRNVPVSKRAVS